MSDRYFGKVVKIIDDYTIVIGKGEDQGVKVGQKFMVVGCGDMVLDPDTKEELERLEIVRGHAVVTHVQQRLATLKSCEYSKSEDTREITKTANVRLMGLSELFDHIPTIKESIKPGVKRLKEFIDAEINDFVIRKDR